MANSLVDLKEKGKTKTTKEAKNMRAMDDDDEEYQPLEDENNLNSDDHLSEYNDPEELAIYNSSTSKRVLGATRGINTERLIAASGGTKLVVAVPLEVGLPVGENATRLASWLGVQIRMATPLKDMEKWDDIPSAIKAPIIQAIRVQLEARHQEDESRRKEVEALGLPVTMPQEEMPMEVLGKKFYVKEYGVSLK
ncbi:hypothetical protein AAC387_Pa05g0821 [Persea americana]